MYHVYSDEKSRSLIGGWFKKLNKVIKEAGSQSNSGEAIMMLKDMSCIIEDPFGSKEAQEATEVGTYLEQWDENV